MNINPFHETKASFLDVPEIIDTWVELGNSTFIDSVMIPDSSMPIRIFGGKGTGKTHILRFFSFQSQLLNAEKSGISIVEQIQKDKYIGVYIEANSLEVNRFSGCGYSEEEWEKTFYYYFNLELIEKVLKKLNKMDEISKVNYNFLNLSEYFFDEETLIKFKTITDIYLYIRKERKNIDSQIGDLSTPGKKTELNIKPLFKLENLFKDIVSEIIKMIPQLRNIKILYIIDEIENFSIKQQQYINTLVRHIGGSGNVSIRLAGRLYGQKTNDTLDAGQKLLENSEVKTIYLEEVLKPNFDLFAKKLYEKRIELATKGKIKVDFAETLQKRIECNKNILDQLIARHDGKVRKSISKLKENLKKYKQYNSKEIDIILSNIRCDEDWLAEKINIYLLFQDWGKDLIKQSEEIKLSYKNYKNGNPENIHKNAFDKYGLDMKYQLFRSYGKSLSYSGYDNILKMSNNNPRIFLSILGNLFSTCAFNGIDLLTEKIIPCCIQDKALIKSSSWFWDNFTTEVKDAQVLKALISLCEFFRSYRRADKPIEKNAIIFSYKESDLMELQYIIDIAIDNSLLIDKGRRKDRNTGQFKRNLRVHPMLSPEWELPVGGGGTVDLSKETLYGIFVNKDNLDLKSYYRENLQSLEVPFKKIYEEPIQYKKQNIKSVQREFDFKENHND